MGDITTLLQSAQAGGDKSALNQIVAALYPDLHRMAHARLAQNGTITLLDTTSMVHETYERLRKAARIDARCRGQFMAYASQVMRSIIVDFARKRNAERRGGHAARVTLDTDLLHEGGETDEDIERVHDALLELETSDPRLKQVVEMRYFGGFSGDEVAAALCIDERTVRRDWERARLLLQVSIRR